MTNADKLSENLILLVDEQDKGKRRKLVLKTITGLQEVMVELKETLK